MATREAYGEALLELGERREDVVVLDADVSKATRTALFAKRFPKRFFNVGVAEQNLVGTAAGLALSGFVPYASTLAVFAVGRAFEQIRNTVAYPRLNVKIVGTHGGITVGEDGASHQAIEDVALMRSLPNMTVLVPCDAVQTRKAICASADWEGPVYVRLGRSPLPVIASEDVPFKIGKAEVLSEGDDLSIVACGSMVHVAIRAAERLDARGIKAGVIDVPSIKPLDEATILKAAVVAGAVVTAEEHSIIGGLGSAVTEFLSSCHPVPVVRVGLRDSFGESGRPEELLEKYGLGVSHILEGAETAMKLKALI